MPSWVCNGGILYIAMSLPAIQYVSMGIKVNGVYGWALFDCVVEPTLLYFCSLPNVSLKHYFVVEMFIYQGKSLHCLQVQLPVEPMQIVAMVLAFLVVKCFIVVIF